MMNTFDIPAHRRSDGAHVPVTKFKPTVYYIEVSEESVNPPRASTPQQASPQSR